MPVSEKKTVVRVHLGDGYRQKSWPAEIFIDVSVVSVGNKAADNKRAIGIVRSVMEYGKPSVREE